MSLHTSCTVRPTGRWHLFRPIPRPPMRPSEKTWLRKTRTKTRCSLRRCRWITTITNFYRAIRTDERRLRAILKSTVFCARRLSTPCEYFTLSSEIFQNILIGERSQMRLSIFTRNVFLCLVDLSLYFTQIFRHCRYWKF